MKNTIIFLGVAVAALLTWVSYALFATLVSYATFSDCLTDDTVIAFFFATGWILPSLVGYDLYKYISRRQIRRGKTNDWGFGLIHSNTFGSGRQGSYVSARGNLHLN